ERYLTGRIEGTVEPFPFPNDDGDFADADPDSATSPEQTAAVLAILHEIYCPGVERAVAIPVELAPLPEKLTTDDEPLALAWRRAMAWRATRKRIEGLGEGNHVLQWFKLQ